MKLTIGICVVLCLAAGVLGEAYFNQERINEINSKQTLWTASLDTPFGNLSKEEIISKIGLNPFPPTPESVELIPDAEFEVPNGLPQSFDTRDQWPKCSPVIRDQQHCHGHWAISTADALAERICIATQGKTITNLSAGLIVSCEGGETGCVAGYTEWGWNYLVKAGTVSESCWPWTQGGGDPGDCGTICKDGETWKIFQAQDFKKLRRLEEAKTEIMTNGSITATIPVYDDFLSYKGGIYTNDGGDDPWGYAGTRILGWGDQKGQKFMIGALSWGETWGENGYFRMDQYCCELTAFFQTAQAMPSQQSKAKIFQ